MDVSPRYHDDLELNSIQDDLIEEPDATLPQLVTDFHTQPRWLQRSPAWTRPWLRRANTTMDGFRPKWLGYSHQSLWSEYITSIIRPRLTIGYVFWTLVALYVSYCYIVWSPFFASKLPQYTGPHAVGAIDVEVPVQEPRKVDEATFKQTGKPAFELDTILFTLYYPAAENSKSPKPNHKWVSKPISLIAEGYATAAHFNNFVSRSLFTAALWVLAGSIDIPAKVDVPLLKETDDHRYPVVVLSHGDVSSRTDYTAYCGEVASRGVIVAAIEHRDGSCPGSIIHLPNGKHRNVLLFRADQLEADKSDKEDINDDWRAKKLAFRDAEIQETVSVLQDLDAGKGGQIYERNYRKEGRDFGGWQHRLNFSRTVIAGHSFGATGALQALRSAKNASSEPATWSTPAIGGIILDPGKSSGRLNTDIDVPLLIVHSDSWSKAHTIFYGRPHFDTVRDIALDVLKRCGATWFMTSLKTSHPSVTDAPLIEPLLLSWTTGATINVYEGLREYVRVSVEFLRYLDDGSRKGVLDVGVTHEIYGQDTRSDEQKEKMEKDIPKYWEVHVAPNATFMHDD